ncbi:hypothetical protein [Ornithinimicrobium pratense]|uniref:Uncharacterized protein n=1 Tax=Ornithinimicrobium pratense TaxID=2593973 RepID=A0A5J6V3G9_9MICO|nr:hypothetical protein [Ornithinimicrobium pratense]QFG68228.1 hypothetical protein FY030_05405 [Ornithinimicrobium pratense]
MSENYTWSYGRADGTEVTDLGLASTTFPTQADAEAWLSQEWATLADAGVASVTLQRDDEVVYGPMSLSPAD